MSQSEEDNSYMAMLSNPVINPGTQRTTTTNETKETNSRLKPSSLKQVQTAKELLENITKDAFLSSETDASFEIIDVVIENGELPKTEEELYQLGLIDERGTFQSETLSEFSKKHECEGIVNAFKDIDKNDKATRVYLVGEISITVLILSLVDNAEDLINDNREDLTGKQKEYALVGVKSLLVES